MTRFEEAFELYQRRRLSGEEAGELRVHEYPDGSLAIFDGPRCLARFDREGRDNYVGSQAA